MRSLLLPTLLILVASLTGCGQDDLATWGVKNKVLIVGNGAEPKTLDPGHVQSVGDSNIALALFEGLVTYHPEDDNKDQPGVAKRWESNEDYTKWTFHLRKDAKWSTGDPVTARDFLYSWERTLTPAFASPYASMLYFLKNAEEFNRGDITDFSKVGAEALDDWTIVCHLSRPTAFFPGVVKHTTWYPVHQETIEKFGEKTQPYTPWQRPGNHVGNGPFMLESWLINDHVSVVRNPHYWDDENVKLNGVWFLPANDYTEERMFRDGQMHVTYVVPNPLIDYHRKKNPDLLRIETYSGSYFYRCNVNKPPLDDPMVRKALALSIDREEIVEFVTQGGQFVAHGFTPPTKGGYQPPDVMRFDPEAAREALAASRYGGPEGLEPFELLINTSESHRKIAEAIQDMWRKHLNLKDEQVEINNQEWKVFLSTVFSENYEMARAGWIADYVDPTTFLDMWRTGDSNNNTGWASSEYDQLLLDASMIANPQERLDTLKQAEAILLDELPVIPIYWYTRVYLKDPRVVNWNPLVLDKHNYKFLDLQSQEGAE